MVNKEHINREVEKTLQSLDNATRAEANPFLFTRIKARMERKNGWERITYLVTRPAVAFSVLFLVIALNGLVLLNSSNSESQPVDQQESIAVNDIADEYNMASSSYYFENPGNE
jgi:hypothetical protein